VLQIHVRQLTPLSHVLLHYSMYLHKIGVVNMRTSHKWHSRVSKWKHFYPLLWHTRDKANKPGNSTLNATWSLTLTEHTLRSRVAGFYHLQNAQIRSGANLASYSKRIKGYFVVLNWPWREADQASPPSSEVKNECSHAFIHPFAFMACLLVKRRKNCTWWKCLFIDDT
jgi:hypothetical protein